MTMLSLSNLRPAKGAKRYPKRVGRGNASGKGTTAGKGTKGQSARTGGRNKLKWIGMKRLVLSTPKLRGFQSRWVKDAVVTLGAIDRSYAVGETVSLATLRRKGLVAKDAPAAKIVTGGTFKKKLTFSKVSVSASALDRIAAAGGTVKAKGAASK